MNARHLSGLVALLLPVAIAAQQTMAAPSMNPVSDAARRLSGRASKLLMMAADSVPADKLGYKPTPAQMSFGEIWAHLTEDNYGFCGAIGGAPAANVPKMKGTDSKEALVAALKGSFAFCDGVMAKTVDSNMGQEVDMGFMKGSRALALMIHLGDMADHYSQISNYMRLNGMLPPSAQPQKKM